MWAFLAGFLSILLLVFMPVAIEEWAPVNYFNYRRSVGLRVLFRWTNLSYKLISLLVTRHLPQKDVAQVGKLFVFPIKSAGYMPVSQWKIDDHGFQYDRQFAIGYYLADKQKYKHVTQRECAKLSKVKYEYFVDEKTGQDWFRVCYLDNHSKHFLVPGNVSAAYLRQHCDDASPGPSEFPSEKDVDLWGVHFKTFEFKKGFLPEDFLEWSGINSRFRNERHRYDVRLMYSRNGKFVKTGAPPKFDTEGAYKRTLFQDYFPLLIAAQQDVDYVNEQMAKAYVNDKKGLPAAINCLNFRANIVLHGTRKPFDSDSWSKIYIRNPTTGEKRLIHIPLRCTRCSIPNVDLETGKLDTRLPVTNTLNKFRRIDGGSQKAVFGIFAVSLDDGYTVQVGDTIDLIERQVSNNADLV